jgi:glycosyltransferase involved in cell wall biosynthesis
VEYLPNGVDVDAFPVPGPGPASDELLFVGRLRPKKNPDDIVRALPRVRQTHPGAVVHLVGTGTLRERLAELVDDRGLSEAVRIHGRVSDGQLQKLYRRCSVFVLPSDWEGHPLVLLEAWASGMVVVGTDVEGIREFVQDTDYGELVPLGDEIQLAETITSLLSHPEQTATRGRRAREYVAENYDWDATAHRTYDLYQSLHRPV